jgi:predicted phosphodiesterase
VVLFGHSHIPLIERGGGVLYANPGSPTDRFSAPHPTYLRLMIGEKIRAEHVDLDL